MGAMALTLQIRIGPALIFGQQGGAVGQSIVLFGQPGVTLCNSGVFFGHDGMIGPGNLTACPTEDSTDFGFCVAVLRQFIWIHGRGGGGDPHQCVNGLPHCLHHGHDGLEAGGLDLSGADTGDGADGDTGRIGHRLVGIAMFFHQCPDLDM